MMGLFWDLALAGDLYDAVLGGCETCQVRGDPGAPGEVKLFGLVVRKSTELPPGTYLRAEDLVEGKIVLYETNPAVSPRTALACEACRKAHEDA